MDEKKKNIIELLNYVVVGGLTTLVNFVVYFFCTHIQLHYLIANVIAWIFAVLFAYIANRKYVFKSEGNDQKAEFIQFVCCNTCCGKSSAVCLYPISSYE